MSALIAWFLLIAGIVSNSELWVIAAGLFAIAAEIKSGLDKR